MANQFACAMLFGLALTLFAAPVGYAQNYNVTTYHYDNLRTGWNSRETTLNPTSVGGPGSSFGLLSTTGLDAVVRTQPLVVANQAIQGYPGTYGVAYVLTMNNSIYAINSANGKILLHQNFGAWVPGSFWGNPNAEEGALSTPVIDPATKTLYFIAYTLDSTQNPAYFVHALNLASLTDKVPPMTIAASHTLSDGSSFSFMPLYNKQRTSLLEANGNIYAGFSSFGDLHANFSRGWVLGWNAKTLTPLAGNHLNTSQATSPNDYFLGSVWMTGAGIAADSNGNLFFTTGNSDPSGTTYNGVTNIQESAVKLSGDLSTVEDLFTPGGKLYGVQKLDQNDGDFSAGGILLTPQQPGPIRHLAAAAGKSGLMYLMNQNNMGGYVPSTTNLGANKVVGTVVIGPCLCAPSYYTDAQGVGHIVSSGGTQMIDWEIQTSPCCVKLVSVQSESIVSGQSGGFFTSVSSNGTQAGSYLTWAVSRPLNSNPAPVTLYAFDSKGLVYSAPAGAWKYPASANIVPVVANGKVFVAGTSGLSIFGLGASKDAAKVAVTKQAASSEKEKVNGNVLYGKIVAVDDAIVTLRIRTGKLVRVDAEAAKRSYQSVLLLKGRSVQVLGEYEHTGVMHARLIERTQDSPAFWGPDQ